MSLTHQPSSAKASPTPRIVIPFLNTEPLTDVRLAVLFLPVWWWLGIEQFVWPVIFVVAAVKVLYLQRLHILVTPPVRWFALFMAAVLVSGFFIDDPIRGLTYTRNLGAFVAAFLVLLIVSNRARSWKSIDMLLNAVLFVILLAGITGLLAAADIWRPSFQSIMGHLLPGSIAGTNYGQAIAERALGQNSWFSGLGVYYRLRSFFLFSNLFSAALIYAIPFLFLKLGQAKGFGKLLPGLGILILIINLIYTTGRVAAIALLGGALYFALFNSMYRRALRLMMILGLTVALFLVLLTTMLELTSADQEEGLINRTADAVEVFTFARGSGSFTGRLAVYEATLSGFVERPLFGWGTERDVEGLQYPAGSHSEYLAVLYRQGLFGLLAFIGLLWSVWQATRPPIRMAARQPAGDFLRYGRWFFVTALINSIMNDPAIDTTTYVLLWLLIALLIAAAQLIRRQPDYAP